MVDVIEFLYLEMVIIFNLMRSYDDERNANYFRSICFV